MPLSTSSHRKNPSDRSKRNPSALEAILQGRNNFESILTWILCMFFIILLLPFSVQFISNYAISLLLIHSFSEIFTLISLHKTFSVIFFWTTYVLPIYPQVSLIFTIWWKKVSGLFYFLKMYCFINEHQILGAIFFHPFFRALAYVKLVKAGILHDDHFVKQV